MKTNSEPPPYTPLSLAAYCDQAKISQPANSTIVLLQEDHRITFVIPRLTALWVWLNLAAGLFFCFLAGGLTYLVIFKDPFPGNTLDQIQLGAMFIAFGVLLPLMITHLHDLTSKNIVVITPTAILWLKSGFLGKREQEWDKTTIHSIQLVQSQFKKKSTPLMQIQITTKQGKKTRFLSGRPPTELLWMVENLRQTLFLNQ